MNNAAESLGFAYASGCAGRPVAFGFLSGFGLRRGGRSTRIFRDFVPRPGQAR